MRSTSTLSAVVGGLLLFSCPGVARAQGGPQPLPVMHVASLAPGSILGVVQDDRGLPVSGAVVSALGTTTSIAVTDKLGRFELRTLTPGPYLVRAHLSGYVASRGQVIEVRSSSRTASSIALRRAGAVPASLPVLTAGVSTPDERGRPANVPGDNGNSATSAGDDGETTSDNHGEIAWRLRHARRGILKDVDVPEDIATGDPLPDANAFGGGWMLGGSMLGSPARLASNLINSTAFSGQVNLLTTGSFDTPQELFGGDNFSRSIAYLALGAPVGDRADWTVRAALTQGDVASWILAGEYTTRAPARHRYDLGWSYSTQRYDVGSFAALNQIAVGSRSAGAMFGFDTFSVTPSITLTYGARYARYDYLEDHGLLSPRVSLTVEPVDHFRVSGLVSRRAVAPGAEELSPRMENTVWLPPQRTFASLNPSQALQAEYTDHMEAEIERDITKAATVSIRAFHQRTNEQLVTVFGVDVPGTPRLGQYFIGNAGDIDATGVSAGIRASIAGRFHGSVEYSTARAHVLSEDATYLWMLSGSSVRPDLDRIHDVETSIEADVPETSTRVVVLYRVSNAFAHPIGAPATDHGLVDSRYDIQVRQSLPFMDFSTAKWEMLVAVRNFFRDTAPDQSVYDELLVVHPPTRVVGGLTLKF